MAISENVEVPPDCELIVMGHSVDRVDQNGMGIIEATENFVDRSGLLIARALVRPEQGSVPLRIMNLSNEPYLLHKGTVVAKYEPVETEKFVKVNSLSQDTISSGESCSHIHVKRLSLSASVVIIIIRRLLATSRIITQYFNHLLLFNFTTSPLKIDEPLSSFKFCHLWLESFKN